jgi:hypothetical protein
MTVQGKTHQKPTKGIALVETGNEWKHPQKCMTTNFKAIITPVSKKELIL